jgi:hypothetical protein
MVKEIMSASMTKASVTPIIDWDGLRAMYEQGASDVEIASKLRISMSEFHKMEKELPTFARFVELGRTFAHAWWASKGRKNVDNKDFNTSLYNFNMKNRYGWADKVETTDRTSDESLNADQLNSEIKRIATKLKKIHPEFLRELNAEDE